MSTIITITAGLLPIVPRVRKYAGMPTATAEPKQINCLLVRFNTNFVLTFDKSLGTLTNAITENLLPRFQFNYSNAPARDLAALSLGAGVCSAAFSAPF